MKKNTKENVNGKKIEKYRKQDENGRENSPVAQALPAIQMKQTAANKIRVLVLRKVDKSATTFLHSISMLLGKFFTTLTTCTFIHFTLYERHTITRSSYENEYQFLYDLRIFEFTCKFSLNFFLIGVAKEHYDVHL